MWRRIRCLPALVALAAAGWLAAPALSVDPYLPAAEDFGQNLPALQRAQGTAGRLGAAAGDRHGAADDGHAHEGEGPVSHRSAPIDAPKRFDLAGIAGELRPYELRARDGDGEWTEWTETADGNPVYFGGADELQVRARGWEPSGELHYVNVSGSTSTADRLLNGARGAINGAFIAAAGIVDPAAAAAPPRPDFVTRGQWGANRDNGGCPPRRRASIGKDTRAGVVHHTVTASSYTRAQAPGIVLGICRFHRYGNGWDDIGYNALTDRFGTTYIGRAGGIGKPVIGAQAQGFNRQTTGMAVLGTHTDQPMSKKARRAFGRFFAWRLRKGRPLSDRLQMTSLGGDVNKYPQGKKIRVQRIIPHRRVSQTECPGNRGVKHLTQIRNIAERIQKRNR